MPGGASQIRSSVSLSARVIAFVVTLHPSFERPQIFDERVKILRFEIHRWHGAARLDRLRIRDPAGEISFCIGKEAGTDRSARANVRKVRADNSACRSSANLVTHGAWMTEKDILAKARFCGNRS